MRVGRDHAPQFQEEGFGRLGRCRMREGMHGLQVGRHVAIHGLQAAEGVLLQQPFGDPLLLPVEERDHDHGENEQGQGDAGSDRQGLT